MISAKHLPRPIIQDLSVVNETIRSSQSARNFMLSYLTIIFISTYIANIRKSYSYLLRYISYIRNYLSSNTTEILVHAFVSSKLDHCNSLRYGLPNYQIKRLQHVRVKKTLNTLHILC